jgi:hypothetical protein
MDRKTVGQVFNNNSSRTLAVVQISLKRFGIKNGPEKSFQEKDRCGLVWVWCGGDLINLTQLHCSRRRNLTAKHFEDLLRILHSFSFPEFSSFTDRIRRSMLN